MMAIGLDPPEQLILWRVATRTFVFKDEELDLTHLTAGDRSVMLEHILVQRRKYGAQIVFMETSTV
jgi:hypothetical protein